MAGRGQSLLSQSVHLQTKSSEKSAAPVFNQVSYLLLKSEQPREKLSVHQVSQQTGKLSELVQNLIHNIRKAKPGYSEESPNSVIDVACNDLDLCCRNIQLSSSALLESSNVRSNRVTIQHHLQDLHTSITKVFLSIEEIEMNKLIHIISWIKELLQALSAVTSLDKLLNTFKQYTEALLTLFNQLAKLQRDLKSNAKRRSLGSAALTVKKLAPSINKCCQTWIKYSESPQAKEHKLKVFAQMNHSLDEIMRLIKANSGVESSEGEEGAFVSAVDQVLTYLNERCEELDTGEFEQLVGAVVRHCLSVMALSPDSAKACSTREGCLTVIPMVAGIIPMCKNFRHHSELQQMREDFKKECKNLVAEVHDLERNVNSALIEIIVDTFKETREPLDRLFAAVRTRQKVKSGADATQAFIDDMNEHSARIFEVARLVADSSSNAEMVTRIKSALSRLDVLYPQLLPSIVNSYSQANHMQERWTQELNALCSAIDEITDTAVFAQVTSELVMRNGSRLKWMLGETTLDIHEYAELVRAQMGLAKHLVAMTSHHKQPRGAELLEPAVSRLREVISNASESAASLALDTGDVKLREDLLNHNRTLEQCVIFIKSTLNDEDVDGSFLSELREAANQHVQKKQRNQARKEVFSEEGKSENETLTGRGISDGAQKWLSLETSHYLGGSPDRLPTSRHFSRPTTICRDEPDISLSQLVQRLLECALSCDIIATELCCNELMERANDIIKITNCVTPYVDNPEEKGEIKRLVTSTSAQTVELSTLSRQLAEADLAAVDVLELLLASWSRDVERLEDCCDRQLSTILHLALPLRIALEMNNETLMKSAKKEFLLTSDTLNSILSSDENMQPELMILETHRLVNTNLTNNINALLKDRTKLAKLMTRCREWACNALTATRTISAESRRQLLLNCHMTSSTYSDCLSYMEHNIKYIYGVLTQSKSDEEMAACQKLIVNMAHLLESTPDPFHPTDELFTDLKTSVLLLRWSEKAAKFFSLVDTLLKPHSKTFIELAQTAVKAHTCNERTKVDILGNYEHLRDSLRTSVKALCTRYGSSEGVVSSHSELLWRIPNRLETMIGLAERLTSESATEELLAEYSTETRLLIVNLLELRQRVSKVDHDSDHQNLFDKILSVSRSQELDRGSSDGLLTRPLEGRAVNHSQHSNMPAGLGHLPAQADVKEKKYFDSPFIRAVRAFKGKLVKWADGNNVVVRAARDLAGNLQDISLYVKYQEGPISSRRQLFDVSKKMVSNSYTIKKFCEVIAKHSLASQRFSDELLYHSNQVTFYAEQLSILTNVKMSTSPFDVTIKALATNGENLLKSILKSLEASESILLKGLKEPPLSAEEEQEIYILAIKWRSQLAKHRHTEINYSDVNDLGLRVISKIDDGPHLAEICQPPP